jgi:hypothetical protein
MLEPPFEVLRCSWPRPVAHAEGRWVSEPDWAAPPMPALPQPFWESFQGELCWTIDWRAWFRGGLKYWLPHQGGEMRGFHVVFHLRVNDTGRLVFWDDDGCLIRRRGETVHADRGAHPPARGEIAVESGDRLEVAQWQYHGGWTWGARVEPAARVGPAPAEWNFPYRDAVRRRLRAPNGPPLKAYFGGQTPVRTALALYSMVLNGYRPSRVLVFGDYQWDGPARGMFADLLPFAEVVPTAAVLERVQALGGPTLAELALRHWGVMKTCVGLLVPPDEYCLIDDDVFILDRVSDALDAFGRSDLVFAPDADYGRAYARIWGWLHGVREPMATGTLNTGLYWLRNTRDPGGLAADLLRVPPDAAPAWQWEQGFLATQFAHARVTPLPGQRYFYPCIDGLPGGMLGYDYAGNPCGFVSVHFGGLAEKPSDAVAQILAPQVLGRATDGGA